MTINPIPPAELAQQALLMLERERAQGRIPFHHAFIIQRGKGSDSDRVVIVTGEEGDRYEESILEFCEANADFLTVDLIHAKGVWSDYSALQGPPRDTQALIDGISKVQSFILDELEDDGRYSDQWVAGVVPGFWFECQHLGPGANAGFAVTVGLTVPASREQQAVLAAKLIRQLRQETALHFFLDDWKVEVQVDNTPEQLLATCPQPQPRPTKSILAQRFEDAVQNLRHIIDAAIGWNDGQILPPGWSIGPEGPRYSDDNLQIVYFSPGFNTK